MKSAVKQASFYKIQSLATKCHQLACSINVGDERTEMFEAYGVLHNLTRRGYAKQVGRLVNPLLSLQDFDDSDDDDDWFDEDGD